MSQLAVAVRHGSIKKKTVAKHVVQPHGLHKGVFAKQAAIECELREVLKKGKVLGYVRLADALHTAMKRAGVCPRVEDAAVNREIEDFLCMFGTAVERLPAGKELEDMRRVYAIAHDRYAEQKFGKPVAPRTVPPPPDAEQCAEWDRFLEA